MPRPLIHDTGPLVTMRLESAENRVASWVGPHVVNREQKKAHFSGDKEIVEAAKLAVELGRIIDVGFAQVKADDQTERGAIAALHSYNPGRTRLLQADGGLCREFFDHFVPAPPAPRGGE